LSFESTQKFVTIIYKSKNNKWSEQLKDGIHLENNECKERNNCFNKIKYGQKIVPQNSKESYFIINIKC